LYYRGRSATELARTETLESVAGLLWAADSERTKILFDGHPAAASILERLYPTLPPVRRMIVALALVDDLAAYDLSAKAVARSGGRILALLASVATMQPHRGGSLAGHLRRAWRPDAPEVERLLERGADSVR
jgi:hypothetical protein